MQKLYLLTLGSACFLGAGSAVSCSPFLQTYPAPYSQGPGIASTMDKLKTTWMQLSQSESIKSLINTTSFSLDVYSTLSNESLLKQHYTAPSLALTDQGVKLVNDDTIYRIASISKAWTAYIWLIAAGDQTWNDPITKYVSELAEYATNHDRRDELNVVDWESITVGALFGQLSGTGRDFAFGPQLDSVYQHLLGLPSVVKELPVSDYCGASNSGGLFPCNRSAFFETNLFRPPLTASFWTSTYANTPWQILGYALETITGTPFKESFQINLVERLSLTSTFYAPPPDDSNSIIPFNATMSQYNLEFADGAPCCGYYSSTRDVSAVGRSILNSTFLNRAQTNHWLKPHAFLPDHPLISTDGIIQATGAPWEIFRGPALKSPLLNTRLNMYNSSDNTVSLGHQTWLYTKSGSLKGYGSLMILMPEFDVGITLLAAGTQAQVLVDNLADIITEILVPGLFAQARADAEATYTGTFIDQASNSSVTIDIADTVDKKQGLRVSEWTYNGTAFIQKLSTSLFSSRGAQTIGFWIYPDGILQRAPSTSTVVEGWRADFSLPNDQQAAGAFSSACTSWMNVGDFDYGGISLDDFRFRVGIGENGTRKATGLELPALQINLSRI